MRIIILGQGAIGSLLALKCHQANIDYRVIIRQKPVRTITCYSSVSDTQAVRVTPCSILPQDLAADDLIIVPTKAYQVVPAIHSIKPFLDNQTIVLLHNGMGIIESLVQQFPSLKICAATTRCGALVNNNNELRQTGNGITQLGAIQAISPAQLEHVEVTLKKLLPPFEITDKIQHMLWHKLAVNCVINPLTAIEQCKNGQLLDASYRTTILQLCDELSQLLTAFSDPISAESLLVQCLDVCKKTATNYSSMNRDIHYNRKTEIEHINGYAVQQAAQIDLAVPANLRMLQTIRQLELGKH